MAENINRSNLRGGLEDAMNPSCDSEGPCDTGDGVRGTAQQVMGRAGEYAHQAREKVGAWAEEAGTKRPPRRAFAVAGWNHRKCGTSCATTSNIARSWAACVS